MLRRTVHGPAVDEPLVWYEGSGTSDRRWLHADERGSVVAVSNSSGSSIATYSCGPYGETTSWSGSRFRYTGQITLPEVELYHFKARAYSPALARFLQPDPIGLSGGLNLYAYANNDPINMSEPFGLAAEDCASADGCTEIVVTGQRIRTPTMWSWDDYGSPSDSRNGNQAGIGGGGHIALPGLVPGEEDGEEKGKIKENDCTGFQFHGGTQTVELIGGPVLKVHVMSYQTFTVGVRGFHEAFSLDGVGNVIPNINDGRSSEVGIGHLFPFISRQFRFEVEFSSPSGLFLHRFTVRDARASGVDPVVNFKLCTEGM